MGKASKYHCASYLYCPLSKLVPNAAKMPKLNQSLPQLVDLAIEELDKVNTLTYNIGNRSGLFDPDNFSLQYTINHSSDKDIPLESISKYKDLIDEPVILSHPGFKLVMQEVKVCYHA